MSAAGATSNTITVSGIHAGAPISITGGSSCAELHDGFMTNKSRRHVLRWLYAFLHFSAIVSMSLVNSSGNVTIADDVEI
jgi:hypothetical protein